MKQSAKRLSLPDFDGAELEKCIRSLLKVDKDWIPDRPGFSCYIRPTLIATEEALGVRASSRAKLFVVLCPVGPYFPSGLKPVKVFCNTSTVSSLAIFRSVQLQEVLVDLKYLVIMHQQLCL
jgi:branched-chain amino acid aminotransferase